MSENGIPTFTNRMMPHLHQLAEKMLKNRDYGFLKTVAEVLAGLYSGGWEKISDEERELVLEQMKTDFHPRGMGDTIYGFDEDYKQVLDIIDAEWRAVTRRRR